MPRFDANLSYLFTDTPWERRFDVAAAAGFTAVEINAPAPYQFSAAELRRRLADAGLACVALLSPVGEGREQLGMAIFPEHREAVRASVRRALEYCDASGARLLHILAGSLPADLPVDVAAATYVENMAWAADELARVGMTLGIEPISHVRFKDYFVRTTDDGLRLMRRIARKNIGLIYDFYHAQMEEGHLSATLQAHIGDMVHIQIGNPPGRHEPGNGELDFDHLFAFVDGLGYKGWVGCEYVPAADTLGGLGWAKRWGIVPRVP